MQPATLTIRDKTFHPYRTVAELRAAIAQVAGGLNAEYANAAKPLPILAPVLTGAIRFVGELLPQLQFAYQLAPVKASSYGSRLQTSGEPRLELGSSYFAAGAEVILLEDIVESGNTLRFLADYFEGLGASKVRVATLLFKPEAYAEHNLGSIWRPDWVGMEIPDAFVVGFGLDYAEEGRYLDGLYALAE